MCFASRSRLGRPQGFPGRGGAAEYAKQHVDARDGEQMIPNSLDCLDDSGEASPREGPRAGYGDSGVGYRRIHPISSIDMTDVSSLRSGRVAALYIPSRK